MSQPVSATADAPEQAQPFALRTLLHLAWPIIISRSTQVVIGVCDAVMVAHLGESALAATTTGAFNTFTILILPMGVCFIVSSFASQLFGANDLEGARRYGWYGLGLGVVTQLFCFLSLPLAPVALEYLPYTDEVRQLMAQYFTFRLITAGVVIGVEALGNYYGGLGRTRLPMIANIIAMVANVGLNWVLINGKLGLPAMGVAGAALASSIASVLGFLFIFGVFLKEGGLPEGLKLSELGRMLKFGLPSGLNWFFEFLAFSFWVNVVVGGLGTTALAAMMAVLQINNVSVMPAFSLASAGSILVGQAIGANRKDDVGRIVKMTTASAASWQLVVGVVYVAMPLLLLAPFASGDAQTTGFMEIGRRMLLLTVAWQAFDATAMVLAEALRAAGDTAFTLYVRLVIAWFIFVPASYYTVRHLHWGDVGAMVWILIYVLLLAVVLLWRFRTGAWRQIQLVDHTGVS